MCQTLSFSGYQGCEGRKSWKISDFIIFTISTLRALKSRKVSDFNIFRISRLRVLQRLQNLRLYHFRDIMVGRVTNL